MNFLYPFHALYLLREGPKEGEGEGGEAVPEVREVSLLHFLFSLVEGAIGLCDHLVYDEVIHPEAVSLKF